ncbi:MAG: DUF4126 domain-containing protein [Deltaproteobacteria bacterium]|nr:DUF4126 domain-containing protein [Deltaproteobacteria bacterium]MBW2068524.1 DUF4126 domain-containing protein [Deltaproteobacteria bacterium]
MNAISTLGTMLGLSFISGINLYATIAVVGLSIRLNLVSSFPRELAVLTNDAIIVVAIVLYVLEFVVDKIPWLDTLWDFLHSFIRPIGGAFIAFLSVANGSPVAEVLAVMVGAFLAGVAHATKASSRLIIQASPEPVSNVIASVAEDAITAGYAYVALKYPLLSLIGTAAIVLFLVVLFSKLGRMICLACFLIFYHITRRYRSLADFSRVHPRWDKEWRKVSDESEQVLWSGPVFVKSVPRVPRFKKGWLIVSSEGIYFYHRNWRWIGRVFRRGVPARWNWQGGRLVSRCRFVFESGEEWEFYMIPWVEKYFRARLFATEMEDVNK